MANGARTLTVTFAGDTDQREKASKTAAKSVEHVDDSTHDLGETFGETASRSAQVAGGMGDLGGALSQMGGPLGAVGSGMELLGPSIMGLTGAADLAEAAMSTLSLTNIKSAATTAASAVATAAQTVATYAAEAASKAWAAAQWLLNAALDANPIALVVIGIAALVAAIVLAWQHSETFRDIITGAFNAVLDVVQAVWGWIKTNWGLLLAIITGPIGLAVLAITRNWQAIKDGVTGVYDWIVAEFNLVVGFITGLPGRITTAAAGMWDGIKNAFKAAVNWIIDAWNGLQFKLPEIDTHIPGIGKVGGFVLGTPDIPRLAAGGIVSRPTLALIGEAGPEAVVPLGSGGFGSTMVFNFNIPPTANPAETGRAVADVLRSYFSAGGRLAVPV